MIFLFSPSHKQKIELPDEDSHLCDCPRWWQLNKSALFGWTLCRERKVVEQVTRPVQFETYLSTIHVKPWSRRMVPSFLARASTMIYCLVVLMHISWGWGVVDDAARSLPSNAILAPGLETGKRCRLWDTRYISWSDQRHSVFPRCNLNVTE